ncbi:hypothetical protein NW767_012535 [Fusarium falciforme]|nr:hypothetical protein NW767_012535 [Fusarium falciforme]
MASQTCWSLNALFNQNPILDLTTREPDDTSDHEAGDLALTWRNPADTLAQTSSLPETEPVPRASTIPGLTQNNIQTNNQNTYNLTVNNTYSEAVGYGGGGGGRVVFLVFVIAAAYGITTFWNNTVTSIQSSFSGLASFVGLSYFAASSAKKPEPSATITFGKATSSITPNPIVPSPSGIVKAIDDVDHWVSLLADWPEEGGYLNEKGVFWDTEGYVEFKDVGGFRDAWIVLSENNRNLEKRTCPSFSISSVATLRPYAGIKNRLKSLREGACGLRDSTEETGDKLTWKGTDDDGGFDNGVTTVTSRGNLLCDIFVGAELWMSKLHKTVLEIDSSSQMPRALADLMASLRNLRHPRHELLRRAEDERGGGGGLASWLNRFGSCTVWSLTDFGTLG